MKVEFDLPEQTLRNFLEAVNDYLEMGDCAVIYERFNDEDKKELEGLDCAMAAAQIGHIVHKAIVAQTDDEGYKEWDRQLEDL